MVLQFHTVFKIWFADTHISKYSVVIVVYFYKIGTRKHEDCKIFWSDDKKLLSSKHVKFASYVNCYYILIKEHL